MLAKKAGSYAELFGDPRWRKNALVGLALASSGIIGLWGIGFFFPDLIDTVFPQRAGRFRQNSGRDWRRSHVVEGHRLT